MPTAPGWRRSRAATIMAPRGGRERDAQMIGHGTWLGAAGRTTALILAVGCGTDEGVAPEPPAPEILANAVAENTNNVLSAVVTAAVRFADSVAVRYGLEGAALDSVTPAVTPVGESAVVPVL